MKLYYSPGSCALAPHIMLAELNYVYELEAVNLKDKTSPSGDYKTINAKGAVPAIRLDNGEILTEGAVISQYLADQKNDSNYFPKFGTMERVRCQEWMNFIATDVHKSFSPFWVAGMISTNSDTQNEIKTFYTKVLTTKFDFISQKLGSNDYLMGKNFTIADAYLFTCMNWTHSLKMDLSKWTNITNWMARVYARPAVQRAMKEQGLLK